MNFAFGHYSGAGALITPPATPAPAYQPPPEAVDPSRYLATPALRDAVNVALSLGLPLLLTGEPGVGKSQLAASLAWELGLEAPLVFSTKTDSAARDLFYRYDSLRHFQDVQLRSVNGSAEAYISYQALGLAIRRSSDSVAPKRSVVLVDEIDKAPRDLSNDILNETESLSFTVPEIGATFRAEPAYRPILIFTSNSEKNLPDAFLRRCVFFHIPFPDAAHLRRIIEARLPEAQRLTGIALDRALEHFEHLRGLPLRKRPATAECLAWVQLLARLNVDLASPAPADFEALALSYACIAKNGEDAKLLREQLQAL